MGREGGEDEELGREKFVARAADGNHAGSAVERTAPVVAIIDLDHSNGACLLHLLQTVDSDPSKGGDIRGLYRSTGACEESRTARERSLAALERSHLAKERSRDVLERGHHLIRTVSRWFSANCPPALRSIAASTARLSELERTVEASFASRLIAAQEEERRRISLELHDEVSQRIAATCIALDRVRNALTDEDAIRQVEEVLEVMRELASGVRGLAHHLHPAMLEIAGLAAALRGHCAELRGLTGLEVELALDPLPRLAPEIGTCLFRVAQAALANVVAHSGACHARLRVTIRAGGVELEVGDAGRGFDPRRVEGGLGLLGMRERVHLLGGSLSIDSRPEGGTVIYVRVPLRPIALG